MAEDLSHVLAEPARRRTSIKLGLDHDPAGRQVQAAGEPQQRGPLGFPAARLDYGDAAELVLDQPGHRHLLTPPRRSARTRLPAAADHGGATRPPTPRPPPPTCRPAGRRPSPGPRPKR